MRYFILFLMIMLTGLQEIISAQDLSGHLWEDRLVLVFTEDKASGRYAQQLDELKSDKEGLDERKLVIYSITPTLVRKGWENGEWEVSNGSLHKFKEGKGDFEVVLLGLDGRVKLRQDQLLKRDILYDLIDGMPMRQLELKNRD